MKNLLIIASTIFVLQVPFSSITHAASSPSQPPETISSDAAKISTAESPLKTVQDIEIIKAGTAELGATIDRQKHYSTTAIDANADLTTKYGKFMLATQQIYGHTMSFEPDIIETPGTSYLIILHTVNICVLSNI